MESKTAVRPPEVLLVEDNKDDAFITRKGFEKADVAANLHHVENGKHCMQFLRREGPYYQAPTPDLILLDLNMPVMDGREVLGQIIEDERLRKLPVVVLTTSQDESDLLEMYRLRCSSYISKPVDFTEFQRVVEELGKYWFSVVILPPKE